jgi:hypothetical protein
MDFALYMSGDFIWVCFGFYLNDKLDMIHIIYLILILFFSKTNGFGLA